MTTTTSKAIKTGNEAVQKALPSGPITRKSTSNAEPGNRGLMKRFGFMLFVGLATGATWFTLFVIGDSGGAFSKFGYALNAGLVIGVFNLIIMVYPTVKALLKRQFVAIRLGIIAGMIVVGFLMPIILGLLAGFGRGLWIGMPWLGVLALILHGSTAVLLTYYKDLEEAGPTASIPALKANLETELANFKKADLARAKAEAVAKKRASNLEELQAQLKDSSEGVASAQKAYDALRQDKLGTTQTDLAAKNTPLESLNADISRSEAEIEIQRRKDTAYADHLEKILDDKRAQRADLCKEIDELDDRLATAERKLELSDEAEALAAAKDLNEELDKKERKQRLRAERADDKLAGYTDNFEIVGGTVDELRKAIADAEARVTTVRDIARKLWHDQVFLPVCPFVLAVIFYSTWNGWVLVAF